MDRWRDGIDATWNHQFVARQGDGEYPVEFNPEFLKEFPDDGFASPIYPIGDQRSHMGGWRSEDGLDTTDPERWSDPRSLENEAGHEFGHLIGIPDEYGRSQGSFEEITGRPPAQEELSASGKAQARGSVMGTTGDSALPRHLSHIEAWLNGLSEDDAPISIERLEPATCRQLPADED
jgi:hypothetical protein